MGAPLLSVGDALAPRRPGRGLDSEEAMTLEDTGGPMARLLQKLASQDRALLREACDEASEELRRNPDFRETLHRLLREGEPRARFAAAFVLFHANRPSLRLLQTLLDSLDLDDGDLRWKAAHMLAILGRMQGEVFPVLLHECRHPEAPRRRRMALYVLRELAAEREETKAAFLAALGDIDPGVRRAALSSLAKLSEPDQACVEQTLEIARSDRDPKMRRIATVVLPDLVLHRPEAREAVAGVLRDLAGSPDPSLARAAHTATHRLRY